MTKSHMRKGLGSQTPTVYWEHAGQLLHQVATPPVVVYFVFAIFEGQMKFLEMQNVKLYA